MKKPFGNNKKGFGQWLAKEAPELAAIAANVRSDSLWLAENWNEVISNLQPLQNRLSHPVKIRQAFRNLNKPAETQQESEVEIFKIVEERVAERVVKAQRLSENDGATEGERASARNAVEKLAKRENMEVTKFVASLKSYAEQGLIDLSAINGKKSPSNGGRPTIEYMLCRRDALLIVSGYRADVRAGVYVSDWRSIEEGLFFEYTETGGRDNVGVTLQGFDAVVAAYQLQDDRFF